MSPRRNHPRGRRAGRAEPLDLARVRRGIDTVETWGHERWRVRYLPAAEKTYRCPGCDHEIRPGVPHVVVWPLEPLSGGTGESERRHWHTACWRARDHRRPR